MVPNWQDKTCKLCKIQFNFPIIISHKIFAVLRLQSGLGRCMFFFEAFVIKQLFVTTRVPVKLIKTKSYVQVQEISVEFMSEIDKMLRIPNIYRFYGRLITMIQYASCHRSNTFFMLCLYVAVNRH